MSAIRRTRHAVYGLKYHMVWIPKYRKLVLKGGLAKRLKEVFQEYSPFQIVQIMKSISAKVVFREFPGIEEQLWGGELWSDGYLLYQVFWGQGYL